MINTKKKIKTRMMRIKFIFRITNIINMKMKMKSQKKNLINIFHILKTTSSIKKIKT